MEKESRSLKDWVKENKTELIITGIVAVGTILVIRNWDSIKGIAKAINPAASRIASVEPVAENATTALIRSRDILKNLTGNKLTASELGNKVWCSAQEINKRIVAAGLATKCPNGGYVQTEAGKLLGEVTFKTTAAGHSFTNIEWDESILAIIFSPEELKNIAVKHEMAKQILAA